MRSMTCSSVVVALIGTVFPLRSLRTRCSATRMRDGDACGRSRTGDTLEGPAAIAYLP
jgi:hypothetical protein